MPPAGWRWRACCTISASWRSAPTCPYRTGSFWKSTSRSTAPIPSRIRTLRAGSCTCTPRTRPSLSTQSNPACRRSRAGTRALSRSGVKRAPAAPTTRSSTRRRSTTSRTPSCNGSWRPPTAPHPGWTAKPSTSTTKPGTVIRPSARITTPHAKSPCSSRSTSKPRREAEERNRPGRTGIPSGLSRPRASSPSGPKIASRRIGTRRAPSTTPSGRHSGKNWTRSRPRIGKAWRCGSITSTPCG